MTTWASIPGETPIDPSHLKIKSISNRAELNEGEIANIRKVFVKYLSEKPTKRMAPFSLTWSKTLHKEMLGDVWKWAGKFRTFDTNIGLPWQQVEVALHSLLEDMKHWGSQDFLDQAALLHHRAVHIHPFPNGNGRWARMLANIWLKRNDHSITVWPEETIGTTSTIRDEYITAIQSADGGDYAPLTELHRRYAETRPLQSKIAMAVLSDESESTSPEKPTADEFGK
jgi:Fic-DOC domain mobile mystery protein B